ncbi:hypothetical protein AB0M54_44885 [Actinoplanes sp. NPDC051470]|uniref:hypothetical protein n=1 Tax=Actinoplanes sp. NPDC051470 TaxID=3157224 RepID=UPI00342EF45C
MTAVVIRAMRAEDAKQVLAIYQAGMDTGNAGFEHTAPDWTAFDASKLPEHRITAITAAVVTTPASAHR